MPGPFFRRLHWVNIRSHGQQGGVVSLSQPASVSSSTLSALVEIGWRAEFLPADHALSNFEFDVIIGADGHRNTLEGEDSSFGARAER